MSCQQIETNCGGHLRFSRAIAITFALASLPLISHAQITHQEIQLATAESEKLYFTLGTRIKSNDLANFDQTVKVRPVIGLRYGKWQLGMGDGMAWRNLGQFGNEPSLSYQLLEQPDLNVGLSLRGHNVTTGESFDAFEKGKNTIRTRVMLNQRLSQRWRMNLDWTQDILNKGDSTTLNFGLSYAWPFFKKSELIFHADGTWATAEHWRNAGGIDTAIVAGNMPTGFEKVSAGLTFKQSLSQHWAWYASYSLARPIAELRQLQNSREVSSAQVGLLYFQR
jgi:hypothetical protein